MGTVLGDVLGKVAAHVEPETAKAIGDVATKTFSSLEGVANKTEAGKFVLDRVRVFEQARNQSITPRASKAIQDYKTTGLLPKPGDLQAQAQADGIEAGFGKSHKYLAAAYTKATAENGPTYAQSLADHVHMYLKDTQDAPIFKKDAEEDLITGKKRPSGFAGKISKSKSEALKNQNSVLDDTFNTGASYHRTIPLEHSIATYFSRFQIPALAINHIGLAGANMIQSEPLTDLAKGLYQILKPGGYQATKQMLLDSGIYGDELIRTFRDLYNYKHGIMNKLGSKIGVPNLGEILGKAYNHPGFNWVRDTALTLQGVTTKLSTERFARMAMTGDRLAELRLEQRGLDPDLIRKQGGTLTQDQLERAIYRGVDNSQFLRSDRMRGYYGQHDTFTRLGTLYHNFVTRQAVFLGREIKTAWVSRNTMQIAKTMAMLTVGYPTVGAITQGLMDLTRGNNGYENTKERVHTLLDVKDHLAKSALQYLDFYAHAAAFGITVDYLHGAIHHELANSFLGPIYGTAVTDAEDLMKTGYDAILGKGKNVKTDAEQIGRDALIQGVKAAGKPLAKKIFPRKKKSESNGDFNLGGLGGLGGGMKL